MKKVLRSAATHRRYLAHLKSGKGKPLNELPVVKEFKHFLIVDNEFPHDKLADRHHLLIPKRRVANWYELGWREYRELTRIHWELGQEYDCIKLNYPSLLTVHDWVHFHLYNLK